MTKNLQGKERAMTSHTTGTREQWLAARRDLLEAEKAHTRRGDELAQQRQALPWVRIDKTYRFETDQGSASLADLFRGRSQLIIYHFMFGPDYKAGCPSCSSIADSFNGVYTHLAKHAVMLWAVSPTTSARLISDRGKTISMRTRRPLQRERRLRPRPGRTGRPTSAKRPA